MDKYRYLRRFMTGITENMPKDIYKIAELVEINLFEPTSFIKENVKTGDCRITYLMNDAVESFIILKDAIMTGDYLKEDLIQRAGIQEVEDGYVLVIHQGNINKFTIKFKEICVEANYYNYGDIGHFWINNYEYLRQLEYQLAVLRDKRRFMGDESCNELEKKLSLLSDFPPIRAYISVSKKYYVEFPNVIDKEGVKYLLKICQDVDDDKLYKAIKKYLKIPNRKNLKMVAMKFHKKRHFKVIKKLIDELRMATEGYDNHCLDEEKTSVELKVDEEANNIINDLKKNNKEFIVYREEAFKLDKDSVTYAKHILVFDKGIVNKKCRVVSVR